MKMLKILIGCCVLGLLSFKSLAQSTSSVFGADNKAKWLEDGIPLPTNDSLFYLEHPAPIFRKEFILKKSVKSATLTITAAGYYKASINEVAMEDNLLDPAWTDFSKRIFYADYDVTSLLQKGKNCIGVALGNGFYNPLPLRKWGKRNLREDLTVGKPVFIAKLLIHYSNGKSEEIVSDKSWKYALGPIVKNSIYIGVSYDANKELGAWNKPHFDDSKWKTASIGKAPAGKLEKAFFPPVKITREITPVNIYSTEKGTWIVDMGENFTGTYRIKISGNADDTIHFRFGERVYADGRLNPMTTVTGQIKRKGVGGPGAPPIAWQTDSYIVGKESPKWFSPDFTYHVFRYMEIKGMRKKPETDEIRGLFMHTDVTRENSFSCSSELLNKIQSATQRTFLSNLVSVQSDCPARERFGYGGDLNATSESFIYNFDMQAFYRKTIYDWVDAINDSVFVDTAPFTGIAYCGISWESAFLTTQYYLYLYYGDTDIIKELYTLNNRWMDKVARIHPEGIVNRGLSDHESMEPVSVQLTGTCHYLQCARIMKTFATVMGNTADITKYEVLENHLRNKIKEAFWDKPYLKKINRQTLFSSLLYHNIISENELPAAKDSLLMAIKGEANGHFKTGIFGTKYALETLAEYGTPNSVFDIVNSKDYPGWGYMIHQGATTIWETWKESDNTFSNNHPMFGTVSEWFYRWLAGIQPDPDHPGFKEFYLKPTMPDGLDSVNCTYLSPQGAVVSNWKKTTTQSYSYTIEIPNDTKANLKLPVSQSCKIEVFDKNGVNLSSLVKDLQTGNFKLTEGKYKIEVSCQ